jgi:transposase InsO family protein
MGNWAEMNFLQVHNNVSRVECISYVYERSPVCHIIKADYRPPQHAEKYIAEIVRLHGIPKTIVSDRGSQFTAHFWEHLHKGLGTRLICSTAYHPQTDG